MLYFLLTATDPYGYGSDDYLSRYPGLADMLDFDNFPPVEYEIYWETKQTVHQFFIELNTLADLETLMKVVDKKIIITPDITARHHVLLDNMEDPKIMSVEEKARLDNYLTKTKQAITIFDYWESN